jgi:hypothetical protein
MTDFSLPTNFVKNREKLVRKVRPRVILPQDILPAEEPVVQAPTTIMAEKTLRDISIPSTANVATRPNVDVGDVNFELKLGLINMVQASPLYGKKNEDANVHFQNFLELCETIVIRGVTADSIRLRLFPFSLMGKAKQWFYKDKEAVNMWNKCSIVFLLKFFPLGKTNALHGKISSFQQTRMESILEAWESLQEYILACPHHGMDEWLVLQSFYNGLSTTSRAHINAAAGGALLDLTITKATVLVEKIVSNKGWSEECLQPH